MKKKLSLFLFFYISTFLFGQNTQLFRGKIFDKNGHFPLEAVHIFEKDNTKNGAFSDKNGYFKLSSSNDSPVFVFTIIGYETLELTMTKTDSEIPKIYLKPEIFELPNIEITAKLEMEILSKEWESVVDFIFLEENILFLKSKGQDKGFFIELVDKKGEYISDISLKREQVEFPRFLFKSCLGSPHLICENGGYQIDIFNDNLYFGKPYSKKQFRQKLKPCVFKKKDKLFQKYIYKNGLLTEFQFFDQLANKTKAFHWIGDEKLLQSYQEDQGIIIAGQTGHNMGEISALQNASIRKIQAQSDFMLKILYKGFDIPVFERNDTVIIFNFYDHSLDFFDLNGDLIKQLDIDFHLNKNWDERVIYDEIQQTAYATFNNFKGKFIARINLETGTCYPPIHLESEFIKKIAVRDRTLFLIHSNADENRWKLQKVKL